MRTTEDSFTGSELVSGAPEEAAAPAAPAGASAVYEERRRRFAAEAERLADTSRRLSWARLLTVVAAITAAVAVVARAAEPGPPAAAGALALALFALLAGVHDRVLSRERRWRELATLQEEGLARLDRDWDRLPLPLAAAPPEHAALARDLQLAGRASLLHLIGGSLGPPGRETLLGWLLTPAALAELPGRQEAVAALAPAVDFRDALAAEGRRLARLAPDVAPFLAWAEGEPWLLPRRGLRAAAVALPAAAWLTAALAAFGLLPASLPLALFGVTFLFANLLAGRLDDAHERVAAREREIGTYAAALALLAGPDAPAALAARLHPALETAGRPAAAWLRLLQRRLDFADARRSGTLRFLLAALFVWDAHTLAALERWQRSAGGRVRGWLAALGEAEVLAALATLAFEEPDWAFPAVDPGADRLAARALGHPLLPANRRVANDVEVGPAGRVLLVTGSNMSGKSTLLRALGANAALAQAGGPVCAAALTLPPVRLATSILVEDSLESGVSFFMAEVLRVRDVVAAARAANAEGRRLLVLLDEILRGTNSADRRVAVREVLARLDDEGALVAISTHDLALAEEPALRDTVVPVHFRETLHPAAAPGEPPMTFDHLLRPGLAPTTNALRLLEMFGLGGPGPRGQDSLERVRGKLRPTSGRTRSSATLGGRSDGDGNGDC